MLNKQLRKLSNRVDHDHMQGVQYCNEPDREHEVSDVTEFIGRGKIGHRRAKEQRKDKLAEARYLLYEGGLPMVQVAKRLHLSYGCVRRIKLNNLADPETAFKRRVTKPKFHKLHQRGRDCLQRLLETSEHPMSLRAFQEGLREQCQLRVSKPFIGNYLRSKLNATYRRIKPIGRLENGLAAKF